MNKKIKKKKDCNTDSKLNQPLKMRKISTNQKKDEASESTTENPYENIQNKYLRCLKCNLIPSLNLDIKNNLIHLKCTCGIQKKLNINHYLDQGYLNNFNNKLCNFCQNPVDIKNSKKFFYCKECEIYFCKFCKKIHGQNFESHHYINLEKFDTNCILHRESYGYFCNNCNENICKFCLEEKHLNHNVIDLDNINLKRKEIKKIKENFSKEKNNLFIVNNYIKKLLLDIKNEINLLLEYKENELEFKRNIIYSYETKIDNYYTISNIKNLKFNLRDFNPEENSNTYIDKLTSFYKYIRPDSESSDSFTVTSSKTNLNSLKKNESLNDTKHIATSIEIINNNKILSREKCNKLTDIINEGNGKYHKIENCNINLKDLEDSSKKYANKKLKKNKHLIRINYINIEKCLNAEEDNNLLFRNKIKFFQSRNQTFNDSYDDKSKTNRTMEYRINQNLIVDKEKERNIKIKKEKTTINKLNNNDIKDTQIFRHKKIIQRRNKKTISNIYNSKISNNNSIKRSQQTYKDPNYNIATVLTERKFSTHSSTSSLDTNSINKNKFTIRLTLKEYNNTVYSLVEVDNDYVACGFLNGEIDIYKINNFGLFLNINEHKARVNHLSLLKDKCILSTSFDYTMKKIKLIPKNKNYLVEFIFDLYENIIYKGIELINSNEIVSISFNGKVSFWNRKSYKNYGLTKEIKFNEELFDVIELKNKNELAISTDENLKFIYIKTHKNICTLNNLKFIHKKNNLISLNSDYLGILLKTEIGIIDINSKKLIYRIELNQNFGKGEIIFNRGDNRIIVGMTIDECEIIKLIMKNYIFDGKKKLKFISEKESNIFKKDEEDYLKITDLIELKNDIIVFGSSGKEGDKLCGNISFIDY